MNSGVKSEFQHLKSEEGDTEMEELGLFSYAVCKLNKIGYSASIGKFVLLKCILCPG